MKTLNQYIQESILDDDEDIDNKQLKIQPKTKYELEDIIIKSLKEEETDLNFIDTSKITNMSYLFADIFILWNKKDKTIFSTINISEWDVSKVTNMQGLFKSCTNMNPNISDWDVSSVTTMDNMFYNCQEFNSDLSKWDVSKVENMSYMFHNCTNFNSDLSKWNISKLLNKTEMFIGTKLEKENRLPEWYK